MIDKMKNMYLNTQLSTASLVKYMTIGIIVLLIISISLYITQKIRLNDVNCDNLSSLYKSFPSISSFNTDDAAYKYLLRDYYVKTAYNCCCAGQFKNDYVNICALKTCIAQGARVLDFEIYSVNDKPVIATSSISSYHTKEMYNQISFEDVLNTINTHAFSGGSCPNPNDPLILHFRIQSNNQPIYKAMADTIYSTIETRLLGPVFSNEYSGHNLGAVPLKEFVGKIIIAVDRSNPMYESTPLFEYVNIASNSPNLQALRQYSITNTNDTTELIEFNKKRMTLSMPDLSAYNTNTPAALNFKYGCQWVGMCFQNFDSNMQYYDLMFDGAGSAFVLKPEFLRYVPVTIPKPTAQDPKNSYTQRSVSSDYYSFTV